MRDKPKCTLTDVELLEACHKTIADQCKDRKWRMSVPVDMNRDSDMLLAELCNRYKKACKEPALGNATTQKLLEEVEARICTDNQRKEQFHALVSKLSMEELMYRTNDQPLTMRSLPEEVQQNRS